MTEPDPAAAAREPILVAGVGNSWMYDDAFGGEVIKALEAGELPPGVAAVDYGTGGLDLAYEVMRGYAALVLVDSSRQGGEPGTLYVMEPREEDYAGEVSDGDALNPHAMDPQSVLRFVKLVGGWPGRVVVIACEPERIEEMGVGLSDPVAAAVQPAAELVLSTVSNLRAEATQP